MKKILLLIFLSLFLFGGAIANEISSAAQEPEEQAPGYYKTDTYQGQGVRIAGLWWAPVNVGYTAENPYALLYSQRSTSKDGVIPLANDTEGAGPSYERDARWGVETQGPCPDGWRVPTHVEWKFLLSKKVSPKDPAGQPGQWRRASKKNPDAISGRWFGPDCKTATGTTPGNAVFFPAAGHWNDSKNKFFYKKSYGNYWSSTIGDLLFFGRKSAKRVKNRDYEKYGLSVRCVQGSKSQNSLVGRLKYI